MGIISVFVIVGIALPFVNESFEGTQEFNANTQGLQDQIGQDVNDVSSISIFTVLLSVLSMFFWSFGALPFWLDGFFVILRIILVITIARNVWIGGGG